MVFADLIVPRGGENSVAIDLIVQHVRSQLTAKGHKLREALVAEVHDDTIMPLSLHVLPKTPQIRGTTLHQGLL